jgi:DNA-binding LacI/PurR family transcriptional regulator
MSAPDSRSRPLYQRIVDDVLVRVRSEEWRPGDRLPSERALCDLYNVSQITVRRALRELAHAGRVYSHHGLGWFVSEEASTPGPWPSVTLILPALDTFVAPIVHDLATQLALAQIDLHLAFVDGTADGETSAVADATARGTRAALAIVSGPERQLSQRYKRLLNLAEIPVVLLLHEVAGLDAPAAVLDEGRCMQEVTEHLVSLGHQRVAYAGLDPTLVEGQKRYWGFASTLWEHGLELPFNWVFAGSLATENEKLRFAKAFTEPDRPTALICASDIQAAEAMTQLRDLGLSCPRDVAIAGLGDHEMCPWLPTPLTSFRFALDELARAASTMIVDILAGKSVESARVSGQLVVRQSCGSTATPTK